MNENDRSALRKFGIGARDSLAPETRENHSIQIVKRIISSELYGKAKIIMIYRAVKGEVSLEPLREIAELDGRKLVYPLCISKTEMIALCPKGEDAWKQGHFGIWEPVLEQSERIDPVDIDLVICPCTVFDENGGRMGMGAGFYDRYLKKCRKADVISVAFECQKAASVPMAPWDRSMQMVFTEKAVY